MVLKVRVFIDGVVAASNIQVSTGNSMTVVVPPYSEDLMAEGVGRIAVQL